MPMYKSFRIKAGFSTLEEAAVRLRIGVNTLSRWETGKRNPSLEFIKKMAALYHVTPNDLLGIDEKRPGDSPGRESYRHRKEDAPHAFRGRRGGAGSGDGNYS